jgi:hypothetical protein
MFPISAFIDSSSSFVSRGAIGGGETDGVVLGWDIGVFEKERCSIKPHFPSRRYRGDTNHSLQFRDDAMPKGPNTVVHTVRRALWSRPAA